MWSFKRAPEKKGRCFGERRVIPKLLQGVEASEATATPAASEPHREDGVCESRWSVLADPKAGGGTPGEALFLRRDENAMATCSSSSVSLSLTIRTLISAIIEVQSRGKDAGESVAPKAEWRAED